MDGPSQRRQRKPDGKTFINSFLTLCSLAIANLTNRQFGQRPNVTVIVNDLETKFLYDSGADVTVMSEKEFR